MANVLYRAPRHGTGDAGSGADAMNAGPLFHCDDVTHGYGCFHLDDDLSNLTKAEQEEWNELVEYGYDVYETDGETAAALKMAEYDVERKYEEYEEAEQEVEDLKRWQILLKKKNAPPAFEPIGDLRTKPMFEDLTQVI